LLLVSLVLAGQNFVVPNTGRQLATLTNTLLVVMGSGAVFAVAAYALSSYFGKIPILGRLTLEPPDPDAGTGPATPRAARTDSLRHFGVEIGDLGVADSPLRPAGKARFGDRRPAGAQGHTGEGSQDQRQPGRGQAGGR
jgi:membrane-bound serine protease (ClpP class)